MKDIKYIIAPGWVVSKYDGERHYIGASRLVALYNVDPKECYFLRSELDACDPVDRMVIRELGNQQILGPRYDGNYIIDPNNSI